MAKATEPSAHESESTHGTPGALGLQNKLDSATILLVVTALGLIALLLWCLVELISFC